MALIKCKECKEKVSDQALMCPHCGFVGMSQTLETLLQQQRAMTAHQEDFKKTEMERSLEEKRSSKRIDIKMMVKINQETAVLFNISKYGMKLASPFTPKIPEVDITLDNGEKVFTMKGTIRWVSSKHSFSNLIDFGVEISEAPPDYYEFIDKLLANN
ncbi:MAG: PilZ domain-containing protein [Acidobacteria bacterium]|nr:PilZ domain-containing protein [Acidobacteriota bacterium]MBU4308136.1 PilZ domain-containing protein [Acidobacteriota bacterium]MCG2811671.1 PilZ domain-containing protein [Candidatus Aminicenantes bacterium]